MSLIMIRAPCFQACNTHTIPVSPSRSLLQASQLKIVQACMQGEASDDCLEHLALCVPCQIPQHIDIYKSADACQIMQKDTSIA